MDKVLRKWWVKHICIPKLEEATDDTVIALKVFELKILVAGVRRDERKKTMEKLKNE